jgi:hypothetical protein
MSDDDVVNASIANVCSNLDLLATVLDGFDEETAGQTRLMALDIKQRLKKRDQFSMEDVEAVKALVLRVVGKIKRYYHGRQDAKLTSDDILDGSDGFQSGRPQTREGGS